MIFGWKKAKTVTQNKKIVNKINKLAHFSQGKSIEMGRLNILL